MLVAMGASTHEAPQPAARCDDPDPLLTVGRLIEEAPTLAHARGRSLQLLARSYGVRHASWWRVDPARGSAFCEARTRPPARRGRAQEERPWSPERGLQAEPGERVIAAEAHGLLLVLSGPIAAGATASEAKARAQLALAAAHLELRRQRETAAQHEALLRLACEVGREAGSESTRAAQLERILRHFVEHHATIEATILLESPVRDHLEVAAHLGASAHITYVGKLWPAARGVVGRCWRSGEPEYAAPVSADPDYVAVNPDVVAQLAVPIRHRGRSFGVLNLETVEADGFANIDRFLLDVLVHHVGGVIWQVAMEHELDASRAALARASTRIEAMAAALQERADSRGQDPMSGLPTAAAYAAALRRARRAARRRNAWFAVAALRVDARPDAEAATRLATLACAIFGSEPCVGMIDAESIGVAVLGAEPRALEEALRGLARRSRSAGAALLVAPALRAPTARLIARLREDVEQAGAEFAVTLIRVRRRGRPRKAEAQTRAH